MSQKNLDPIGPAVLTFIGYERKDRQTDKQSIFIIIIESLGGLNFFDSNFMRGNYEF